MYFGEHYTATSTNIMRATDNVQQLAHPDFQARQVLVATWHRVSPLSIVQSDTLVSLQLLYKKVGVEKQGLLQQIFAHCSLLIK